jgi:carbon monoxide dehydrogenase subunit G
MSKFLKALEDEATEQLVEIRAARTYQGNNPEYKQKAKIALGVIGSYVRLRATLANERTNELVEMRLLGGAQTKALTGVSE